MKNPFNLAIRSIKTKLIIMTLAIVMSIILFLTAVIAKNSVNVLGQESKRQLAQSLQVGAEFVSSFIAVRQANLEIWSANPLIAFIVDDPILGAVFVPSLREFFHQIKEKEPWIENIFILKESSIIYSYNEDDVGSDRSDASFDVVNAWIHLPVNKISVINLCEFNSESNAKDVMVFMHPLITKDKKEATLILLIDIEKVNQALFKNIKVGQNGFILLGAETVSGNLWVPYLSESRRSENDFSRNEIIDFIKTCQTNKTFSQFTKRFQSVILAAQKIMDPPIWLVGVADLNDVNEPVKQLVLSSVLLGIVALLFGISGAFYLSAKLTRPILQLTQHVKEFTAKNLTLKDSILHPDLVTKHYNFDGFIQIDSQDEMGVLADAYNLMVKEIQDLFMELQSYAGKLKQYSNNLEELVKERTAELGIANEQLQEAKNVAESANRSKSQFLANMSHELRTPMNAVLGFSQLMLRDKTLTPENIENLQTIIRSGEHLLTMLNQVLDMSKIEAGKMSLNTHAFDIHLMLNDLEEMFRLRTQEKNLHLIFERSPNVPQYIETDEVRLRQVLINLLSNAVKFTSSGGIALRACVQCEKLDHEDKNADNPIGDFSLNFEVEDTGSGMDASELKLLFKAFNQTESGRLSKEGTGLGLAISRQFVKLMGGEITVSSEKGRGTVFNFFIRVKQAQYAQAQQPARQVLGLEPDQDAYRILIVDDKLDNRILLVKLLHTIGFEVMEAENGEQAVEIWRSWSPHLIWMDMRMPVMDGFEATRHIKSASTHRPTPVIALTASVFVDERKQILSAGCDDFVRKPFKETEIFEMMEKHIGVRFIYEEAIPQSAEKQPQISSSDMKELPSDLLIELENATIRANITRMDELIEEIQRNYPDAGKTFHRLATEFEYEKILALIREARL